MRTRILWLMLAGAATVLAAARYTVPAAAWLAPIFMLRFLRMTRPGAGLWLGALVQAAAWLIGWHGVLPFAGWTACAVITGVALFMYLPYVTERFLSPRVGGFAGTLIYPMAWVSAEYLSSLAGYGTWGAVAYTQWANLPLLQVIGITDLWGIPFLIGWTATVVNQVWERGFTLPVRPVAAAVYAAVMAAVLLTGNLRLALTPASGPTVTVAGITVDNTAAFMDTWGPLQHGKPVTADQVGAVRASTQKLADTLITATEKQADSGAKIILWSEGNAMVLKQDEPELTERGRKLAAEKQIYLFMAMATVTPGQLLVENKAVGIGPDGALLGAYLKSHPTPAEGSVPGDGLMRVVDTPYGRIAWAICYDYDYPGLIRQAGRAGADILLNPSWESASMDPLHTRMAVLRSIENGAAMVRQTNDAQSIAVDHLGNVLARMDHRATAGPVRLMAAQVPTRGGGPTVYDYIGDLLAWVCIGGLLLVGWVDRKAGAVRAAAE